jgi:hypothetical protein
MVNISSESNGGYLSIKNKTGENVVQAHAHADEYGNGVVGAYNRKGMGRKTIPPRGI